jgi:RNA polymerase sigma factor (sigma-70 family)
MTSFVHARIGSFRTFLIGLAARSSQLRGMQSVLSAPSETRANLAVCAASNGARASHGDSATGQLSFERIYGEWFDTVSRWVLALGARPADHEDLVQDVFTVAYRRLDDFDGINVAGWLYQIARRKVRDYQRLAWVQLVFTHETSVTFQADQQAGLGPLDELETKQKSELLSRLLATLPSAQQAAFMLFELEGFSGHQIAERQKVPINTVWVRIHTARKKLKSRIERAEMQRRQA